MEYKAAHWIAKLVVIAAMLSLYPSYGYTGPMPDKDSRVAYRGVINQTSENKLEKFELVDKGDYYYLNTGEEASFLRLKNTYFITFGYCQLI